MTLICGIKLKELGFGPLLRLCFSLFLRFKGFAFSNSGNSGGFWQSRRSVSSVFLVVSFSFFSVPPRLRGRFAFTRSLSADRQGWRCRRRSHSRGQRGPCC